MTWIALAFALLFALVHIFIGRLHLLDRTPRSRWLSAAGGVAVAYVFLHILPELAEHREVLAETEALPGFLAEPMVFLVALAGLVAFYGLSKLAAHWRRRAEDPDSETEGAFWLHLGSFAVYNLIVGYLLLHREETGLGSLLIFGAVMSLHFVTADFGLRHDHRHRYDSVARWILAGAVLGGWALGTAIEVPESGVAVLFAFLAGGMVLNVLKEELPEERESSFLPFLKGTAGYSLLLLAL
ncbi:ZIP family metal transporter [Roseivivax sp. CAU 1761]